MEKKDEEMGKGGGRTGEIEEGDREEGESKRERKQEREREWG